MQDVADAAGVSRQLVSLVMRATGYVAEEKRALVLETAERLGYRRNALAARLAAKRSQSVGMLVYDLHNPVFADLSDGAARTLDETGNHLILVRGSRDERAERRALESLLELRVDGILLAGPVSDPGEIERLLASTPSVTTSRLSDARLGAADSLGSAGSLGVGGRDADTPSGAHRTTEGDAAGASGSTLDSVTVDDEAGAALAVEHLAGLGCTTIAHLAAPVSPPGRARARGYREAMERLGLEPLVFEGDFSERGGALAMGRLLDSLGIRSDAASGAPSPVAAFCYNDLTAVGAMDEAVRRGLRVPQDVALVGFDNTRIASLRRIDLTSVDQDAEAIGRRAAELLLERIADPSLPPRHERIEPRLVVRGSTAAAARTSG